MTRYANGRAKEYDLMKLLEQQGFNTFRSAGSHGPVDVVAFTEDMVRFIQVKRSKVFIKDIYFTFSEVIDEFQKMKVPYNVRKEIYVWNHGKWEVIHVGCERNLEKATSYSEE